MKGRSAIHVTDKAWSPWHENTTGSGGKVLPKKTMDTPESGYMVPKNK